MIKSMVAWDRQRGRKILQNVFWLPASKQSSSPSVNQVKPLTTRSMARLGQDLLHSLPSGDSVLVVVDYFSRYYEIEIMHFTKSEKIIESLERIFMIHGLQLSVTSDNGLQFVSSEFERYLERCGIEHRKTTSLWPKQTVRWKGRTNLF